MYLNMLWLVFSIGYIVKINLFNNSSIRPKYFPINVLFQNKKLFQTLFYSVEH